MGFLLKFLQLEGFAVGIVVLQNMGVLFAFEPLVLRVELDWVGRKQHLVHFFISGINSILN